MNLVLVPPDDRYEKSFAVMVQDFYVHKEMDKYAAFSAALENFSHYVTARLNEEQGIGLSEGFVAAVTYWLTDEVQTIYGTIRYRPVLNSRLSEIGGHIGFDIAPSHRRRGYGTAMLRLLLEKIDPKENNRVLLTCDIDNTGSKKIIENNGGTVTSEIYDDASRKTILRYWIRIG